MVFLGMGGVILAVALIEAAHGMAYRDDLTGLPGRRALNEALLRAAPPYALAMVDVDFFKKFNDRHGHQVGDQVLCMVAARLREIGGNGRPFRYGGEEFTVLFPGTTAAEALVHLESLREAIGGTTFVLRGKDRPRVKPASGKAGSATGRKTRVTVSIGIAGETRRERTPQEVLKAADQALYRAKDRGRNQVAF